MYTFCVGPVGVKVRQSSLVADLLECLGRLVVHLEDTARSPPAGARSTLVGHILGAGPAARRVVARVKGDGALEEDWGRQLGGIDGGEAGEVDWSEAQRHGAR
jgi:hypothetical protein